MHIIINKLTGRKKSTDTNVYFVSNINKVPTTVVDANELKYIKVQHKKLKKDCIFINRLNNSIIVQVFEIKDTAHKTLESIRRSGDKLATFLNENKIEKVIIIDVENTNDKVLAFAEGMALSNYQFIKYKTDKEDKQNSLKEISIKARRINPKALQYLNIQVDAVYKCRDMVNEPVAYLNAEKLSEIITEMAEETGMKVEVFNRTKIEALKMGGLLAVNLGSIDPPTFTIMEY